MVYSTEDARSKFKPAQENVPPAVALTGVQQFQDVITRVAEKYCPYILDASTGLSKDEIPVLCSPEPNNPFDDAAVKVEVAGEGLVGYLPRHAAAFYFDALTGKTGGVQKALGCIATAGQSTLGFRIYGSSADSPLGTWPGDMGWEWVETDNSSGVGYWIKNGEVRPRHRSPS